MDPATPTLPSPSGRHDPQQALTDQALLAVHMGRALAAAGRPNVAHLVAALAGEPDGLAGTVLRRRFGETSARIALHEAIDAAALPSLETAFVALPVVDRPCWTLELLAATRRVGGEDLTHLLEGSGLDLAGEWDVDQLAHRIPPPDGDADEPAETYGRYSLTSQGFTDEADLAVARTRAEGGNSHVLLARLEADVDTRTALERIPAVDLDVVVARARTAGAPVGTQEVVTAVIQLALRGTLDHR